MRAEFVNPFVTGATSVIQMVLATSPKLGSLSARPRIFTTQQFNVVCGITGDVMGQVIYGMSGETANKVSDRMLGGMAESSEELAASTLAELGNMISGTCMTGLASNGYNCDITPPTIIRGVNVSISTVDIPALVIPLEIPEIGTVEINVSLKTKVEKVAAA